MRTKLLIF